MKNKNNKNHNKDLNNQKQQAAEKNEHKSQKNSCGYNKDSKKMHNNGDNGGGCGC